MGWDDYNAHFQFVQGPAQAAVKAVLVGNVNAMRELISDGLPVDDTYLGSMTWSSLGNFGPPLLWLAAFGGNGRQMAQLLIDAGARARSPWTHLCIEQWNGLLDGPGDFAAPPRIEFSVLDSLQEHWPQAHAALAHWPSHATAESKDGRPPQWNSPREALVAGGVCDKDGNLLLGEPDLDVVALLAAQVKH